MDMNKFEEGFMAGFLMNYSKKETEDEKWQYPSDWLPLPEVGENEAAFLVAVNREFEIAVYDSTMNGWELLPSPNPYQKRWLKIRITNGDANIAPDIINGVGNNEIVTSKDMTLIKSDIGTGTILSDKIEMYLVKVHYPNNGWIKAFSVGTEIAGASGMPLGAAQVIAYNIHSSLLGPEGTSLRYNRFGQYTMYARITGSSDFFNSSTHFFYQCYILQRVDFDTPPSRIGDYTFHQCYCINDVNLPDLSNVTDIGYSAFYQCLNIKKIYCPNVTHIGSNAFIENLTELMGKNFQKCYLLSKLNAPKLKMIGEYSFQHTNLQEINLPDVERIYNNCFMSCYNLKFVYLPVVESLGDHCFSSSCNVINIYTPLLTTAGTSCFNGCYRLETIDLSSLETVTDNKMGDDCYNLQNIKIKNDFISGFTRSLFLESPMISGYSTKIYL